jgi:hypothetical protein
MVCNGACSELEPDFKTVHLLSWGGTTRWAKTLTQHRADFAKRGGPGEVEILAIAKERKNLGFSENDVVRRIC